ncbi:MAG: hypothetical protein RMM58_08985 [Chloroflexota bacterium]|nr:hypothetical protein [Dehalococcoidia bacterium]MDW8254000.1 hypothetical protein [Chloroflexota bacterium]
MLIVHRAFRRAALPFSLPFDPALAATVGALGAVGMLAAVEAAGSRDGVAIIQQFGLPAASLVVWVGLFHWAVPATPLPAPARPLWPVIGGLVLAAAATTFIAAQSNGQPWGMVAIAAASYFSLFGAAVLRREGGSGGLLLLLLVQLAAGAGAFALFSGPVTALVAATVASLVIGVLLAVRPLLLPRRLPPLEEIASLLGALRSVALVLVAAAAAGVILSLVIGGQTAALGRLLVPLVGLAATRLVAEEVFLRLWLLPCLERRIGAAVPLLLTAACSAAIAAVARPTGLSPVAAAASALAPALAAGVLARRTRNGPAVVVFRLLAG